MSWRAYSYKDSFLPIREYRDMRRMLRGIGRGRGGMTRTWRPRLYTRSCCCCPLVFVLGLAGLSLAAGSLYLGVRFLGWA